MAQGVRQGLNTQQPKTNNIQQQTQQIGNQMRQTVKNSRGEVRHPTLREIPRHASANDTTVGLISRLLKQLKNFGDDLAGTNAGTVTTPETEEEPEMDDETKRFMAEAMILMTPPEPPTKFKSPEVIY